MQTVRSDTMCIWEFEVLARWSEKEDQAMQQMTLASMRGQIFVTGESETSKLHFVAYIELYRYP